MQMVIGPRAGAVEPTDLSWAYPWPAGTPWLRAMMVTSLDGAVAGRDGKSGSISSRADRAVLAEVRRLADAVLIGAGTMRAERYRPMRAKPDHAAERAALGLAAAPTLAIVSASLDLPWDEPVFSDSAITPIVLTSEAADPQRLADAQTHADVVVLPGSGAEPQAIVAALADRGLRRVVCEGGPRLLADLAAAGLVDEADISISPMFVAGGQVVTGPGVASPARFTLAHAIEHEGFLFNRYVADGSSGDPA